MDRKLALGSPNLLERSRDFANDRSRDLNASKTTKALEKGPKYIGSIKNLGLAPSGRGLEGKATEAGSVFDPHLQHQNTGAAVSQSGFQPPNLQQSPSGAFMDGKEMYAGLLGEAHLASPLDQLNPVVSEGAFEELGKKAAPTSQTRLNEREESSGLGEMFPD